MFILNYNFIIIKNIKCYYSTIGINKLCPNWVTGFSDAESSFSIRIVNNKARKVGWRILPIFSIEIHKRDILLLKQIQTFFGVGNIYKHRSNMTYTVQSFYDLSEIIIPHFNKYPLLTQKRSDFLLFKFAVHLLNDKVQASYEGLQTIINIRASMNKGLSKELWKSFPKTIPLSRPAVTFDNIIHPNWLVGFVDGEGCFYVKVSNSSSKLGYQISLVFSISQHSRDKILFNNILKYLECGLVEKVITRPNAITYCVYKFSDICDKLIPLFKKYPLQSVKILNFADFCVIANLMANKLHLTKEGIDKIRLIKSQMNNSRINK